MSAVRAAASLRDEPRCLKSAEVSAMQDQLYEILATGVAPGAETPIEAIEAFLHEHARDPKPREEFTAFFEQHELDASPTALPPPQEGFTLPDLTEVAPVPAAVVQFIGDDDPTPLPSQRPSALPLPIESDLNAPLLAPQPRPQVGALWAGIGLLLVALAGGLWLGYGALQELRQELGEARRRSTDNEAEIGQLRGQAAGIESSVAANGELIQRMDQKSDLMLRSLETREQASGGSTKGRR